MRSKVFEVMNVRPGITWVRPNWSMIIPRDLTISDYERFLNSQVLFISRDVAVVEFEEEDNEQIF